MQGKEGQSVRIATAHRPCESLGASTAFHQQARGLSKTDDHRNPLDAFLQDLAQAIKAWKEAGDHIIIGMDANKDVRNGEVNMMFEGLGLREAMLDKHKDKSPRQHKTGIPNVNQSTACGSPHVCSLALEDVYLSATPAHLITE
jgi:hypothetical protein